MAAKTTQPDADRCKWECSGATHSCSVKRFWATLPASIGNSGWPHLLCCNSPIRRFLRKRVEADRHFLRFSTHWVDALGGLAGVDPAVATGFLCSKPLERTLAKQFDATMHRSMRSSPRSGSNTCGSWSPMPSWFGSSTPTSPRSQPRPTKFFTLGATNPLSYKSMVSV